ncbi:MAG: AMP-binding protein [Deltaproteobacteria bacterium]|nr:AMP-binding protein [Deltaproteobacteria bacterium]
MGLHDFTFYDLISRNALIFNRKIAWLEVDNSATLTFLQYKEEVDRLASGLRKAGIKKKDRIGILGKNSMEYFLLFGAASALGAIILPLNWRLSPDELLFNLNDCEPSIIFVGKEFQETVNQIEGNLIFPVKKYNLGRDEGDFNRIESLFIEAKEFYPEDVAPDDGFTIIHTAAVAGRPRGALLSHQNILLGDIHFDWLFGLKSDDVHLNVLPLFHAGGLFMVTSSFHIGALNINMSRFDAIQAVDLIAGKKASLMMEFSPMLASLLDESEKTGKDISSLRSVAGIDSPNTIERYQQYTGGNYYCLYGQTETSCVVTFGAYDDCPGSAGKIIPFADVMLVNDSDQPVGVNEIGEISVKGPMVFKGYWNLPADTADTFRNGRHHTGDLGRMDNNGFLWYEGRKAEKELIKPGGENVYPAEVEKVILEHPSVDKTVVFGVPDPKWKEGIKAICTLKEGADVITPGELIDFVGERIARFKKPQYVEFIKDMPLLDNGSPDRLKVKEMYGGPQ